MIQGDMESQKIRVLLVEDDEEDYLLLRDMLDTIPQWQVELDWAADEASALAKARDRGYDICFLDHRLGEKTGLDLMRELHARGFCAPIVIFTGQGNYEVDLEVMLEGAADYLEKGRVDPEILERTIRYAITQGRTLRALQQEVAERVKANEALRESERQLRLLSARLMEVQEQERKAVARDLHDSVGSCLSAVKLGLARILQAIQEKDSSANEPLLEDLMARVHEAIEETRRIQQNLRPPVLDDLGLLVTLRALCRDFKEMHGNIRITPILSIGEGDVPERLKIVLYRICQEALNNIAKHSGADLVRLSLIKEDHRILLNIVDNGRGFDPSRTGKTGTGPGGMGLNSMRERAALSDGSLTLISSERRGTAIKASWPIPGGPVVSDR
jgi:signal transduction histidine kinase